MLVAELLRTLEHQIDFLLVYLLRKTRQMSPHLILTLVGKHWKTLFMQHEVTKKLKDLNMGKTAGPENLHPAH